MSHGHRMLLALTLSLTGVVAMGGSALAHGKNHYPSDKPLVIKKQGSFFINEETILSDFPSGAGTPTAGHISANGMYVQYMIPDKKKFPYPVIMIHGSGHTGKTYEETPDGREGWQTYFPRKGWSSYVVDHAGRARSGFDPTPTNQAKVESNPALIPSFTKFTNESAWTIFRIGATPFTPHPGTQFPVSSFDQYSAQIVPNTETSYEPNCQSGGAGCSRTIAAVAALLDKIGPAVVMVHSQSGGFGLAIAIARPKLVKAVVAVEPVSCAVTDADVQSVFTQVPLMTIFGDFLEGTFWPGVMATCVDTVARIRAAGGVADNFHLPDAGFTGNSHMLMLDKNNRKIADFIMNWVERNVDRRHGHHHFSHYGRR
jgi:pimeloyl-ACP methyl ester carboxylesterase